MVSGLSAGWSGIVSLLLLGPGPWPSIAEHDNQKCHSHKKILGYSTGNGESWYSWAHLLATPTSSCGAQHKSPISAKFLYFPTGKDPLWVNFKYECLANYCTLCGLIEHKKFSCPTPPMTPPANYGLSLTAASPSYPRVLPLIQPSIAASGAIAQSSFLPSNASAASSLGGEWDRLQLVTWSIQPNTLVPLQPTIPYALTEPLDEGHVGSFSLIVDQWFLFKRGIKCVWCLPKAEV